MPSSHARKRLGAIFAAIPVLVAGGPMLSPAHAAGEFAVTSLMSPGQLIGPNIGYLGHGIGHGGTTALFKVDVPAESSITGVTVTLGNDSPAFNFARDLVAHEGLALYADVDGTGNAFSLRDRTDGLRSSTFEIGNTDAQGNIPVNIRFAAPATGATTYYVTVRPAANAVPNQKLRFEIRPGDIDGSGGADGPTSAVSTPAGADRIILDSGRPGQPGNTAFVTDRQPAGTQDAYLVAPSIAGNDPTLKVLFFNGPTDTGPGALLRRPEYDPTLAPEAQLPALAFDTVIDPEAPTSSKRISIGDGTGIVPGVTTVARNNQLSNAVYARLMDSAGNLSAATQLWDCPNPNTNTGACSTVTTGRNGNPVVAPVPPQSVAFALPNGNAVTAVNIANQAAAPVAVKSVASAGAVRNRDNTAATTEATQVIARIAEVGPDGKPDLTQATAASTLAFVDNSDGTAVTTTNHSIDTRDDVDEGDVIAVAYHSDNLGNVSTPVISGVINKDVTAPTVAVHLPSGGSIAAPGEVASVHFSEPMNKASISEVPVVAGTGSTERCATEANYPETTVSEVLSPKTAANEARTWGAGNCYKWNADGTGASIRFGDKEPPLCDTASQVPNPCTAHAGAGTRVYLNLGTGGAAQLRDVAGNQAIGIAPSSGGNHAGYTTIIAPPSEPLQALDAAITLDSDKDGFLDGVEVKFTLGVDLSSFEAAQNNLSVVGTETVGVTSAEYVNGDNKNIRFRFASTMGTGVTPRLRLSALPGEPTKFKGTDGRDMSPFSRGTIDKAAPQFKTVKTADSDDDGSIDRVIATYSEPIDHTKDWNSSTLGEAQAANGGYRVTGYENTNGPRNTVSWDSNPSDTKIVHLAEKTTADTGATPLFTHLWERAAVTNGNVPRGLYDPAGNATLSDISFTVTDGASPKIMTRHTRDFSGNGRLDGIDLTFSEAIPAVRANSTVAVAGYTISGRRILGQNVWSLTLEELTTPGVGDTGVTPGVQYLSGMADMVGNATKVDTAPVTPTDGAGPAIMGACVASPIGRNGTCPSFDPETGVDKGAKLGVFFSEVVDAASVAATEFAVQQPLGTDIPSATAVAVAPSADAKSSIATLTYAADTLDYTKDVHVALGAAGVITDAATPTKNPSAQVATVLGTAFPTVGLTLTCPSPANPGFCSDLTVNSLVTGTSGVTTWRLEETEGPNPPLAEEFKTEKPGDTYIFPAEGEYTLYLSGMDAFGRLSDEVAKEIWILKAPKIMGVELVNTPSRPSTKWSHTSTVLDGDVIKIGADAYGTDAAEWAEDGQPTDGGCLKANMSIDQRALTGRSTDGDVAPGRCDLHEGEQPSREMIFNAIRASGTTKYPVGTVIRVSTSDPGSMIVDGPNGTIERRQFISANARRTWAISDAQVITVPTALRDGIKRQSKNLGYRDGALLRSSTGYYYVENGVKRPVSKYRLGVWKISTSRAYSATTTELRAMPTGKAIGGTNHAAGTWIKYSDGRIYHLERNASGRLVRRQLASRSALRTLLTTSLQVYPANSADSRLPIDNWLRGYRDGTLLRFGDGTYGVIARSAIRRFANPQTFNTLGFNASNALTANGGAVSRVKGQSYLTGTPIDRRALAPVTIKVTNIAGTSVTAQVPSTAGLYGVGTIHPVPAGWDFTR